MELADDLFLLIESLFLCIFVDTDIFRINHWQFVLVDQWSGGLKVRSGGNAAPVAIYSGQAADQCEGSSGFHPGLGGTLVL